MCSVYLLIKNVHFQARCAAQKLFATLEKERADYFKTITEEEMDQIPTLLLLHLP